MFSYTVMPGFSDSDALGHINNTRLPVWFENARDPIFKIFTPEYNLKVWPLILARITVDFQQQIYLDAEIEVKTTMMKIGNSSFTIKQQAWQNGQCAATGEATMVHFDYQTKKTIRISDEIREQLEQHFEH
ncbi:MAG: acyl-CoA thioesterase [Gammaproteobacteria bacterium]|nr:acyl-CoA thioesterase [Gammaproteobacteria bacterium]